MGDFHAIKVMGLPETSRTRPMLRAVATHELFQLGAVYATSEALREIARVGMNPFTLVKRHRAGDWGVLDASDYEANFRAVQDGSRIVSVYRDGYAAVMIITAAADERGVRSATTLMVPSEYGLLQRGSP